jgi:hypothetical protein
VGEILHARKACLGIFGQRSQHDLLNGWGQGRQLLTQWSWRRLDMLDRHAYGTALERWDPAEPLVDSHSQRVLIAGWRWHTVELLRCHVRGRAGGTLRVMDGHAVYTVIPNRCGEAKVTQHQDKSFAKQHVLRLYIAVDDHPIMSILQR